MSCIRARVFFAVAAFGLLPYLGVAAADPTTDQDAPKKAEQAVEKKPDAKKATSAEKTATAPAKPAQGAAKKEAAPAKPQPAVQPLVKEKPDEALAKQFEQQFGGQFQNLYRTELHLLRVVCKLTKPQYQKVAADGEPALKATKEKFLGYWREQQQGRWGHSDSGLADPRETLSTELEKALQKTLTPEQAAAYKKERNLRTAAQRRAIVKTLIVMMDRSLVLSAEQRDKIHEVLDRSWNDSWYSYVVRFGGNYFPAMPDAKILPILNENQKSIWKGIQKANVRYGFYGLELGNVGDYEEIWDDEVPARPAQPTPENKADQKSKQPSNTAEKK